MCAYRPHPVGRNRPRSLCRAGSRDDRGGRRAGAFGYGTDGFQQGRRIGDGARKRDEPCRDHRPEQGHRGAGRRCRVHAAGQNRRPADNRRGAGRTDRRPRSGYRTQIRRAARIAAPGCVPLRGGCTGARRHARRAADHGAGQCRERRRSATRARCRRRGHRTFPERVPLHAGPGAPRRRDAVCGIPCRGGALRGTSADCTDT